MKKKGLQSLICVIDDDPDMLKYLTEVLTEHKYSVKTAATGTHGIILVKKSKPDLVLLDLMLPDINGISICKEIKNFNPAIPVVMLTAKDTTEEKIKGLNNGADDYIVKPFSPEELMARIHARLRASHSSDSGDSIFVDDLTLNLKNLSVMRSGKQIFLTPNEFNLLAYLMRNVGTVLTRDMILNNIWQYTPNTETRVVDVYIGYLRKKIDVAGSAKLIHSIRGFGYMIALRNSEDSKQK